MVYLVVDNVLLAGSGGSGFDIFNRKVDISRRTVVDQSISVAV